MTETANATPTEPQVVFKEWDVPFQFARIDASHLYTYRPVRGDGAA